MDRGSTTLKVLFSQALKRYRERTAIVFGDKSLTYRELDEVSDKLASGLRSKGVQSGDFVALLLKNCTEYVIADLAIGKLNAVKVPLNHLLSEEDVDYILDHSGARVIIAHQSLMTLVPDSAALIRVVVPEDKECQPEGVTWQDVISEQTGEFAEEDVDPLAPALLMYTGGTTGKPKGVLHTQAGLGLNMLAHIVGFEVNNGDIALLSSPLPHSAGFILQAFLLQGGKALLTDGFHPDDVLEKIEAYSVNCLFLVPTMIYRLLDSPVVDQHDTSSLKTLIYGAAPITQKRLKQAVDRFGPVLLQIYAQTECPNVGTILKKEDHLEESFEGSCGQPSLTTEIRVVDSNGVVLPSGETGEVQLRSGYLLSEYFKSPGKTQEVMQDGWLSSGDIGYQIDSGHLFLVDRVKDMIITGGLNVYCSEVEGVIEKISGVKDVAVIGIPHEDWGEAIHAVIVPTSKDLSAAAVIEHGRSILAKYKVPKSVEFVESLPLTNYGKIDKKQLRSKHWSEHDRGIN